MEQLIRFFKITNVVIKNGHMSFSRSDEKNSLIRKIFLYFIIFFVFINLIFGFFLFTFRAYRVLERIQEQSLIIALALQMITLAVFIFALFYVVSVMYFSNDIDNFMGLPIKPYEIFIGKFINVVIYEYFAEILFVLPVLAAYGVIAKMKVFYYLYGLVILITIPIIPVAIVSVIYLLLMSVLKISNNSERTKMIAAAIFIIAGLVLNMGIQKIGISIFDDKKLEQIILQGKGSILKSVSFLFPTSGLASETLIYNSTSRGLFKFVLFLISNIGAVIVVILLSQKLYFRGILNSKSTKKTSLEGSNCADISKLNFNTQGTTFIAMLKREYRNLF
jgi:ABC-2 type transport system permease protein